MSLVNCGLGLRTNIRCRKHVSYLATTGVQPGSTHRLSVRSAAQAASPVDQLANAVNLGFKVGSDEW